MEDQSGWRTSPEHPADTARPALRLGRAGPVNPLGPDSRGIQAVAADALPASCSRGQTSPYAKALGAARCPLSIRTSERETGSASTAA